MWRIVSKTLAALEALFTAPFCLFSTMALMSLALGPRFDSVLLLGLFVVLCLLCPVLTFSCLVLTLKLLFEGRASLLQSSRFWWWGIAGGSILAVAGLVSGVLGKLEIVPSGHTFIGRLQLFAIGVPLLIPALHVSVEALVARRMAKAVQEPQNRWTSC
jgi:hypothetical protein